MIDVNKYTCTDCRSFVCIVSYDTQDNSIPYLLNKLIFDNKNIVIVLDGNMYTVYMYELRFLYESKTPGVLCSNCNCNVRIPV